MPITCSGRVAAWTYLLMVLSAVVTWMVAASLSATDSFVEGSFSSVLILTFPLGLLCYGLLGVLALGLGSSGVVPTILFLVVSLVVFVGAAVVNIVTVRGLWRWYAGRPRSRGEWRQV